MMDSYLNNEMNEAIQACGFAPRDDEAIRGILMRERSQRNSFSIDENGTIVQYDRIISDNVSESEVQDGTL